MEEKSRSVIVFQIRSIRIKIEYRSDKIQETIEFASKYRIITVVNQSQIIIHLLKVRGSLSNSISSGSTFVQYSFSLDFDKYIYDIDLKKKSSSSYLKKNGKKKFNEIRIFLKKR